MAMIKTDSKSVQVKDGDQIIEACKELGLPFGCHSGLCGTCEMEVVEGAENLSELTDEERMLGHVDKKHRQACQCRILKGVVKIKF